MAALQSEEKERVAKYRAVYVTEITDELHFYTQDVETGKQASNRASTPLQTAAPHCFHPFCFGPLCATSSPS